MRITLSQDLGRRIRQMMKVGKYSRPEDVVRAAIESLSQQQALLRLSAREIEALYPEIGAKISAGMRDARAGRLTDGEKFFDELERNEERPRKSRRKSA